MPDLPPRRRSSAPAWTRPIAERLTPTVKVLVVTQAVLYLFYVVVRASRAPFQAHLAVGPGLFHGEVWQPLTALFVHFDPLSFVLDLIGLWFVGAFVERTQGARRFLVLFFVSGILAMVTLGLVGRFKPSGIGGGSGYAVLGMFVAFGRMYDRAPAQILGGLVMQARYLTMLLVGFAIAVALFNLDWASLSATLVATAAGFVLGGQGGLSLRDSLALMRAKRLRRRYRVLDGGQTGERPASKKKDRYWN